MSSGKGKTKIKKPQVMHLLESGSLKELNEAKLNYKKLLNYHWNYYFVGKYCFGCKEISSLKSRWFALLNLSISISSHENSKKNSSALQPSQPVLTQQKNKYVLHGLLSGVGLGAAYIGLKLWNNR